MPQEFKHKPRRRPAGADVGIPFAPRRGLCPLGCNPIAPRTGKPYVAAQKGRYGGEVMDWVPALGHNQMAIQLRCENCGKTWYEDKPSQQLTTRAIRKRQAKAAE